MATSTPKQKAVKLLKKYRFKYEELKERHPYTRNFVKLIEVFIPARIYRITMPKGEAHSLICRNWQDVIKRVSPIVEDYEKAIRRR